MRTISTNDIARAIYESSKDKHGKELEAHLKKVTEFLAKRRLLAKKDEILRKVEGIANLSLGIVKGKVLTAVELSTHTKNELTHSLKKRYGAKEIKLEEKINEELLGGFRIEVGDEVIDLSLKNKVRQLKEHLKSS